MSKDFASINLPDMPTFEELTIAQQLSVINQRLDDMQTMMVDTERMVRKVIGEIAPVVQEVIPMISNLVENPMVRMMLKAKK